MGGYGTWEVASEFPGLFTAIIPVSPPNPLCVEDDFYFRKICGGCSPEAAPSLKKTPIWNFHGKKDNIIPISQSDVIINVYKHLLFLTSYY
jgi:predicted peptidase